MLIVEKERPFSNSSYRKDKISPMEHWKRIRFSPSHHCSKARHLYEYSPLVDVLALRMVEMTFRGKPLGIKFDLSTGRHGDATALSGGEPPPLLLETGVYGLGDTMALLLAD